MRIGLLGGTFNPVHNGHLHQAREMLRRVDEVWWIPANISPHKLDRPPISGEHRLNMIKLAIKGEPRFKVLDIELKREGPSYTIDTVQELLKQEGEFFLIISDDMITGLPRWKSIKKLIELPLLVGQRHEGEIPMTGDAEIDAAVKKRFVKMPLDSTSATEVRRRLKEGLSCEGMVPPAVLSYITEHQLYKD